MDAWPVQDAKARFSEFLEACLSEGPQLVTRRGVEAAVLVRVDEWRRLQGARAVAQTTAAGRSGPAELVPPERGKARRRAPAAWR